MKNKRDEFITNFEDCDADVGAVTHMIVFVRLPSGALEMIINTNEILTKFNYYKNAYNDRMELMANPDIKIETWVFASE